MRHTVAERLYPRLVPCADPACGCACKLWTLHVGRKGYGQISVNGKPELVHRVAWQLEKGPIPDGLTIDHVRDRGCRHKHCAETAHMEPVTLGENATRGHRTRPAHTYHGGPRPKPHDDPSPEYLAMLAAWLGDPADSP